jgi:sulfotransferase family protein
MSQRPIFLLSLPRSGSTLLQRVLTAHDEISTAPEPWLLLPQLYALRERGATAEYGHVPASRAIREFANALPNGHADYQDELRAFVLRLYEKASGGEGAYFLDKTPRYYFIADELFGLFPDAKFIFLWRNPLAVVASISETWGRGRWNLERWRHDLFEGIPALVAARQAHPGASIELRYEDLISDPHEALRPVFDYLEIPYATDLVTSFTTVRLEARMGDRRGPEQYGALSTDPLDKWKGVVSTVVRKRWCRRYLEHVGGERLAVMGYDLPTLVAELDSTSTGLRHLGSDLFWSPASRVARVRREAVARML